MSKHGKPIRSAPTLPGRAKAKSAAWNASSTRSAPNWLSWRLLTAYDRLLRLVCVAAGSLLEAALNRRRALRRLASNENSELSVEDRAQLLRLGFEPVGA